MRSLMIWDQGINYLLARGLEPLGVEVDCMHRTEFDPFAMTPQKWKRRVLHPRRGLLRHNPHHPHDQTLKY